MELRSILQLCSYINILDIIHRPSFLKQRVRD
jgi:hypothetical protein